ncbi:uncharacterized protein TNCV_2241741 [Trichonephila clavipes]|nr:uncharacterized protein TNCV_2241741 [Trichonephila clavipes]
MLKDDEIVNPTLSKMKRMTTRTTTTTKEARVHQMLARFLSYGVVRTINRILSYSTTAAQENQRPCSEKAKLLTEIPESPPPIRLHHFLYYCGPKPQFQRQIESSPYSNVHVNQHVVVKRQILFWKSFPKGWFSIKFKKIELREDLKSRRGLAVSLEIICHNCGESTSTMSSKISNKCYDVNLRLTYGMRAIGKGGAAARIFCGLMNLPPPPAKFERHNSLFLNVLKTISEDSMNAAVHEAVIANDNNSNIAVAVDGTWHKRGYSSLNGVVCATSVENGKRSETSRKACYTQYLGDGDSKGFLTIKEAKVYGDTEVEKLECVGHVQKRMGTRLRNILKMSKGIKLSDGKNISGRGRLTLKEVDSIQHYYGLAIRKNLSSVEDMKRAIWAIYFHKLSTEDNPQHALCPLVNFIESEKKVFRDLTEKDLLKKCLHGRTQNPNESFNKCIWERIPKTVFVGIETLKFGVMDAVICFNDGYVSRIKVFEALGIKPGYNTERALLIIDNKRIFEAERIVNKVSLEARNKRRSLKRKMDKQNLDEENESQAGKY